jgi:lycopene cyclase domain-containing protein
MTYILLTISVLAIFAFYTFLMRRWLRLKPLAIASAVMLFLTLVFDNLIIASGIVDYDPEKISGIRLGVAPIEDFAYTLVALVLIPTVFNFLRIKL